MTLCVRQKGSRRYGLPVEFPLVDNQGVTVLRDRRKISDRRGRADYLDIIKVIRSEMLDD